jgi:subtilisin family serine protease
MAAILVLAQVATAAAVAGPGRPNAEAVPAAKVSKGLADELAANGRARFVVEFSAKANLAAAAAIKDHSKRGQAVLDALRATADGSQVQALAIVDKIRTSKPRSYWLTNVLLVTGDAKLANQLAALPGVIAVRQTKVYPLVKPVETDIAILAALGDPAWGVEKIRADEVWAEGITGAGIVVANVDTGVEYTHEALVNNYRGNNHDGTFSHDFNWWDPTGFCGPEPCDNAGHGTHTMGTIAGGDAGGPLEQDIGVAPGAEWIAAKGCEDFGCTEESLLSSGQFIVAPTDLTGDPETADPDLRPDIVNNSWGSDDPNDTFYMETVLAWRAAGIIPVFSAGNAGEFGCGTAGTPGNFIEVISLGATDDADNIAFFSSRGPSPTEKISPNISAPGVEVISSLPGGSYGSFSGTSMASPHAAGTIALMMSARTELRRDFDAVLNALNLTAVDRPDDQCGTTDPSDNDPNYVYGEGRIDAKAAVDLVKTGGTLAGTVTDEDTAAAIPGARVVANDGSREFATTADEAGHYSLFLAAGTYTATADAFGYRQQIESGIVIVTDVTTTRDFALEALPRFNVTGTVRAAENLAAIRDATVVAVGTPVAPAITDAAGHYSLTLPVGNYTLRASAGGCTEVGFADISVEDHDVIQNFSLFRKLDDFGHGCRPIPFVWTAAPNQTGLFGDEFAGRLTLPFVDGFEFYGETYRQVFLADNGYMNFLAPDQFNFFPIAIPNPSLPNAAIYPFWQDLVVDEESSIDYGIVGSPAEAFVIEYDSVKMFGASPRLDFQVVLWADGRIDFVYGDNPANPGDGRSAGIGIENHLGNDALQFSFLEPLLGDNQAFRFERVPTGIATGVVTDTNDGLPVAGAVVRAVPGGRSATTDADGVYRLRLWPGSYNLTATAALYSSDTKPATIVDGAETIVNFSLDAPVAAVAPPSITETVSFGETVTVPVTLSNPGGSADLIWEAKERSLGAELPPLPEPGSRVIHDAGWGPQKLPAGLPVTKLINVSPGDLSTIITDPGNDSLDANELISVRAGSDGSTVASVSVDFDPTTPMGQVGGYVYLDIDQNPSTGLPAEALFGLPAQDIGMEYFATLFEANGPEPIVPIWNAETFELVAIASATVENQSILFDIPLEAVGGDDGFINTALVVGWEGPSDWGPDAGHGEIQPFTDLPWLSASPESGTLAPDASQAVQVTLGSETLEPGTYQALLVFVSNAPRSPQVSVEITLTVELPDDFGAATGIVTDAHTGEPLAGASVVVHATRGGDPLDLPATTDSDGGWRVVGPEGTWPFDVTLADFVPGGGTATIVRGVTTPGADVALHRIQPHAGLDIDQLTFVLVPNRTGQQTISLTNKEGHENLTFTIGERPVATATNAGHVSVAPAGVNSHNKPAGHVAVRVTPSIDGQPTLVLMDTLPWDSDALLQVLDANGIAHDEAGSAEMDTINLTPYKVVFIANDQSQVFYDAYLANFDRFDTYVQGGGILWFETAAFGFQDGSLDGVQVPGGLTIHGPQYEDQNAVVAPDHPLMVGVPNPFNGTSASHTMFSDLPAGATVIANAAIDGNPTLVEYDHGAGHVIALAQPLEFAWANDQDGKLILENGVPYAYAFQTFSDVPWLSVSPTEGTVAPDGLQELAITVNTAGLAPGVYRALVVVLTNDPDNSAMPVSVTLVIPAYQQGINAGGAAFTAGDGVLYAADRGWAAGSFGYVGSSNTRSTRSAIAGTEDDALYQNNRERMTSYRFDVPNGTYTVDLKFAEFDHNRADRRVFHVTLEGSPVLFNFDVFAEAGRNAALDRTFTVEVFDGQLDIGFASVRDKAMINAILVTETPLAP